MNKLGEMRLVVRTAKAAEAHDCFGFCAAFATSGLWVNCAFSLISRITGNVLNVGVAKLFDPRAELATAWPLECRIQCDLRHLCKNRLLKCIVVQ